MALLLLVLLLLLCQSEVKCVTLYTHFPNTTNLQLFDARACMLCTVATPLHALLLTFCPLSLGLFPKIVLQLVGNEKRERKMASRLRECYIVSIVFPFDYLIRMVDSVSHLF